MTLIYLYGYDQCTFSVMKAQRGCLIERLRRIIKSNVFRICCGLTIAVGKLQNVTVVARLIDIQ